MATDLLKQLLVLQNSSRQQVDHLFCCPFVLCLCLLMLFGSSVPYFLYHFCCFSISVFNYDFKNAGKVVPSTSKIILQVKFQSIIFFGCSQSIDLLFSGVFYSFRSYLHQRHFSSVHICSVSPCYHMIFPC